VVAAPDLVGAPRTAIFGVKPEAAVYILAIILLRVVAHGLLPIGSGPPLFLVFVVVPSARGSFLI
jgi:hypothetical protein